MRHLTALMGIVPLGIGVTVLAFLWAPVGRGPFGGAFGGPFGGPPLFFRLIASFIALNFVLAGLATIFSAKTFLKSGGPDLNRLWELAERLQGKKPRSRFPGRNGYQCEHCGAPLDSDADVSPHGDAKCAHCGKWFNIHQE